MTNGPMPQSHNATQWTKYIYNGKITVWVYGIPFVHQCTYTTQAHTRTYSYICNAWIWTWTIFEFSNKTNRMANETQQSPDQMELGVKHPAGCEFPILYCHFILHT